jgi:hypothetical protein
VAVDAVLVSVEGVSGVVELVTIAFDICAESIVIVALTILLPHAGTAEDAVYSNVVVFRAAEFKATLE